MRNIILDVNDQLLAQAIKKSLIEYSMDFQVHLLKKNEDIMDIYHKKTIHAIVMEVLTFEPYKLNQRLIEAKRIKESFPNSKVVLLTDESEGQLVNHVKQAKIDGLVDNFVFSSVTPAYLAAIMDTL